MSVVADVFKADSDYLANEEKYKQIRDGTVCVACAMHNFTVNSKRIL